jgi:hypothetical protein
MVAGILEDLFVTADASAAVFLPAPWCAVSRS